MQKYDIIICIDDSNSDGKLQKGNLYRILSVIGDYFVIMEFLNYILVLEHKWHKTRFRKYEIKDKFKKPTKYPYEGIIIPD